ncbi:MAG TPA: EAL domain-containing protein [Candidatus Deferrimicrobiaceae bacterium]|nr:EAL domain-containing protein [Candidatus Deferrimicrobiaceae bacterium]
MPPEIDELSEEENGREFAGAATLIRATRWFGGIVLPAGAAWAVVGLAAGAVSSMVVGLLALVFGAYLLLEASSAPRRPAASLAARLATATLATSTGVIVAEPVIGPAIAIGSLIPVVLALPYVDRPTLRRVMVASAIVGVVAIAAPSVIPWGEPASDGLRLILPAGTLVIVYGLFVLFLRNASGRMADTANELRHVVAMSRDLAATLEPRDVGSRLARHIAEVAGADECAISTWDQDADRVVTFGYHPPARATVLEPSYDLAYFPATRNVLERQQPYRVDVEDAGADRAEIAYLRSIGQRSSIMLPLVVRGESIGIVELTAARSRAFSDRQLEMARLLVREAAVTFDNARLYESLRQQAFRDSLTGLANRAKFHERVDHALERLRGRSPLHVALLFIDLDQFKLVNDQYGHTAGDRVLQTIADRIRAAVRPGDTPARLGGDEFAVLLEDVDGLDSANAVSQRVLDALARPVELDDQRPVVGGSVGIAVSGPGADTTDVLLRNADIAMYAAKAAGRGQLVHFRPDLLELAFARSELAAMLRGAAMRNELQLHFQPIVRLEDGAPVAVEALVRWQPEGHVLHMPAEFLNLAEETGEIVSIGRWVVGEACRQARTWQVRLGLPELRLHVNLSARQFRDPGLVPLIRTALTTAGLEPAALTVEVTESTLLTHTAETRARIADLRRLGVRIAIDDFGTGYSSLAWLHNFEVDELKIDRTFVSANDHAGEADILGEAIVELGRALGLEMIAEGIETDAQAAWFGDLGCRLGQGYRYARPMPAPDVERFLRRSRRIATSEHPTQGQPKPRRTNVAAAARPTVRATTR